MKAKGVLTLRSEAMPVHRPKRPVPYVLAKWLNKN